LLDQVAPEGCREFEALCRDRIVVLHLTCRPRRNLWCISASLAMVAEGP
jgi:hypothetical protein